MIGMVLIHGVVLIHGMWDGFFYTNAVAAVSCGGSRPAERRDGFSELSAFAGRFRRDCGWSIVPRAAGSGQLPLLVVVGRATVGV
ncbi:MAG: hypothetical protein WD845_04950 [Pirellulales bacterium]